MSLLNAAEDLIRAVGEDAMAAWGLTKIETEEPRTTKTAPYGIVWLENVTMESEGVKTIQQVYSFLCVYRGAIALNTKPQFEKITKANALITRLMANNTYADLAFLPMIQEVNFNEGDAREEKVYEVSVRFDCRVSENRIVS